MKSFADEIDFQMELSPQRVKELLEAGYVKDGEYVIKPVTINDAKLYSPISPYNYSESRPHILVYNRVYSHCQLCMLV